MLKSNEESNLLKKHVSNDLQFLECKNHILNQPNVYK